MVCVVIVDPVCEVAVVDPVVCVVAKDEPVGCTVDVVETIVLCATLGDVC